MRDYHSVLARAVSRLSINNAQTRQEVYKHARRVLVAHLGEHEPEIPAHEAIHERIAFEMAVLRLEADSRPVRERGLESFARYVLNDTNDVPDVASLLRVHPEAICSDTPDGSISGVSPPPDRLIPLFIAKSDRAGR